MTIANTSIRAIKSYVRRTGRLTPGQKFALDKYWDDFGLDFSSEVLDIDLLASGFKTLKLEIGIGNGDALISMASNDQESLYLGVEVHSPGIGRCLNNIAKNRLSNIRLISHDAIEVMQSMLPAQSLDRVLLFFPDPWHKQRHKKRRIVNQQFRDLLIHLLKPEGGLHMATDWQDYAKHMAKEMLADPRFKNMGDGEGYVTKPAYRPLTRFENRGVKLGHGVWDLVFQKV